MEALNNLYLIVDLCSRFQIKSILLYGINYIKEELFSGTLFTEGRDIEDVDITYRLLYKAKRVVYIRFAFI